MRRASSDEREQDGRRLDPDDRDERRKHARCLTLDSCVGPGSMRQPFIRERLLHAGTVHHALEMLLHN
jgi:hypothetical protein